MGFIIWTNHAEKYVDIDIMEFNPKFRNKGFGKILYQKAEEFFKERNYISIKLFCSPESSELFWRKMNFIKFPKRKRSDHKLIYYKPLIDTKKFSVDKFLKNKIELWNIESYQVEEQKPTWTWKIDNNNLPILQPCNPNWHIRLTKNEHIIKEGRVKHFDRQNEIEFGLFLYLIWTE